MFRRWLWASWFSLFMVRPSLAYLGGLEVGQAKLAATSEAKGWQSYRFVNDFPDVPVVVVMPGASDYLTDPSSVRLRNISRTHFEASIAEPLGRDGSHPGMNFNYIAMSQGIFLVNGSTFEAGVLDINERQAASCRPLAFPNKAWAEVRFQHNFSQAPVFLTYIQSSNGEVRALPTEAPSEPWLTMAVTALSESSALVALDSNTAPSETYNDVPETIGYIALEKDSLGTLEATSDGDFLELHADAVRCEANTWLDVYSASARGCMREILEASACSQAFINYGSTSGRCGCIEVNADCTQTVSDAETKVYRILSVSSPAGALVTYLGLSKILEDSSYKQIKSGSWPSVGLGSALQSSSPVLIASPETRGGGDGVWYRLNFGTVSSSSAQFIVEEAGYSGATRQEVSLPLASSTFTANFAASGSQTFSFSSCDVTQLVDSGAVFKDSTELRLEVQCSQSTCLDILRVGGDSANAWMISGISSQFTVNIGQWQSITVPLWTASYTGSIPWNDLTFLEVFSDFGNVDFSLRNLELYVAPETCNGLRDHGRAETLSVLAFDAAFHVEVGTTTTSTTSTSTSSTTSSTSSSSSSTTTTTSTSTSFTSSSSSSSSTSTSSTSSTSSSSSSSSSTTTSSSSTASSSTWSTTTGTGTRSSSSTSSSSTSSTSSTISSSTTSESATTLSITTSSSSSSSTSSSTRSTVTATSTTSSSSTESTSTSISASTFTSSTTSRSVSSTSSTRSTSMAATMQAMLLVELEQSTAALVSELLSAENGSAVVAEAFGTMTAVKLPGLNSTTTPFVSIAEGSPAAAVLPLEVLAISDGAALVMTAFNGNSSLSSGLSSSNPEGGSSFTSMVDAVDISLVDLGNLVPRKISATTPIYVRIATSNADPAWRCAYLDGDTWSVEGVRLATAEELRDFFGPSADISGVWCATLHLSIFSAVIDVLLDCTNLNVLSPENLQEVLKRGWWIRPPALLLAVVLIALLGLLVLGFREDGKIRKLDLWRDEYFLTEVPPVSRCNCASISASVSTCVPRCVKEPKRFQDYVPAFTAEKSLESFAQFNDWVKHLDKTLEPNLPVKMQELVLCQNTLREVAFEQKLHPAFMMGHIWGPQGWVQGSLAVQKSPKLKSLHMELQETLPKAFRSIHSSRWRRLLSTTLSSHPVGELWQWNLHIASAKRAKIIADCILGSLAFVALFFSVDGSAVAARKASDCPVQQGTFLWYAFVAIASICLNLIPRSLITYFAYRGFVQHRPSLRNWQLRVRRCKDVGFWVLGVAISSLQLLLIMAFLANLREADEWKWMISFLVVLARKMLIVPLLACMFSSIGTELAALTQPSFASKPPKQFGLDMDLASHEATMPQSTSASAVWMKKVEELANRGITIRQLVGFYADLIEGTLMPHFDPDRSTTHDVVRQAIIPSSLKLRTSRSFMVVIHNAAKLAARDIFSSDPYCVVNVSRSSESKRKWQPWKGMGRTRTIKGNCNPSWNEAFLMQYVLEEDAIHFSVWDEDALSKDDALGEVLLPSPAFWCGFEGDLRLQGVNDASLRVSIRPYDCNADGVAALDNFREKVSERKPSKRVLHIRDAEASEALPSNGADSLDLSEKLVVIPSPRLWPLEASRGAFEEKAPTVSGLSYASCVNMGRPCPAEKMVTHSWGNKFSYLIGAILGDALQAERYDGVVELLKKHQFQELCEALTRNESLDTPYWVCAFSVNQHRGICATPPVVDSMGYRIVPCDCATEKHFNGDLSEMNKFDDMMAYLKRHLRRMSTTVRLEQVVAMEPDFALLKRVWCIAELVEANELHLNQTIMIHSAASRNECLHRLFSLDVRMAEASYPADKDLILAKIVDVDRFNNQLQESQICLFDRNGITSF
ncbi:unnamed protein product [Durusdinium trenchii]|uniref:C2 domain-containing protein n=1 Tax=Durusdinium trenchii TaxID=1381693 RepID=A0ABP0HJU2_9DINO